MGPGPAHLLPSLWARHTGQMGQLWHPPHLESSPVLPLYSSLLFFCREMGFWRCWGLVFEWPGHWQPGLHRCLGRLVLSLVLQAAPADIFLACSRQGQAQTPAAAMKSVSCVGCGFSREGATWCGVIRAELDPRQGQEGGSISIGIFFKGS